MMLSEGPDVNSLGAELSPSPKATKVPSTPVVVPPTPSPAGVKSAVNGPSQARSPSPASSSNDFFYDAEDSDVQTKRRSMFRSPGMASSPDLATLVRKAKEKAKGSGSPSYDDSRKESAPLPQAVSSVSSGLLARSQESPKMRQRSSTSSATSGYSLVSPPQPQQTTTVSKGKLVKSANSDRDKGIESPGTDGWVLASAKSQESMKENGAKHGKSSVRARTSAFLGKMLGQGTTRERSRTDATYPYPKTPTTPTYGSPASHATVLPPVPPLPKEHQSPQTHSSIVDVFSSPLNTGKPLPVIQPGWKSRDYDRPAESSSSEHERSRSRRSRSRSPEKTIRNRPPDGTIKRSTSGKRRSLSAGEFELKQAFATEPLQAPSGGIDKKGELSKEWESMMNGISSEFQAELSLSPISPTLESREPSTPISSPRPGSSDDASGYKSRTTLPSRPRLYMTESSPPSTRPTLTIESGPFAEPSSPPPNVSPRNSSLQVTPRRNGLSPVSSPRGSGMRYGSRSGRPSLGLSPSTLPSPGDASRLRVQQRSTASSSEPYLPLVDEVRAREHSRTVRLIPSTNGSPSLRVSSQQDLTTNSLIATRFPTNSVTQSEDVGEIEAKGHEVAIRCWNEDEDFIAKEKIAEWLGRMGEVSKIALHHYMEFFDFSGLRLDLAFRRLCAKLYLKAETQQVDRILEEFSKRYWDCNPGGLYGSASVVHSVAYSLLLLNTDLHVAELVSRMSRTQFVRNTLAAIQSQIKPNTEDQGSNPDFTRDDSGSLRGLGFENDTLRSRSKRSGSLTSWTSVSRDVTSSPFGTPSMAASTSQLASPGELVSHNGSTASVQLPTSLDRPRNESATSIVYGRNWDSDMETLLKDMYNAVKNQQILQPLGTALALTERANTLSPTTPHHTIIRSRSQRGQPDRLATLKRGSIRGLQTLLGAQAGHSPYSSNSSIDGRASPSPSFATSTYDQTMSGSSSSFLTPTLGFASNLSHTIIRETQEDDTRSVNSHDSNSTTASITDEELALLGAPWAKEGMLCRKQYWESTGKRAKSKTWMDVFVVIQKGELNMFTFGDSGNGGHRVVGGGNWLSNAQPVGNAQLAHSLAHVLPPPGYNRQRPHCFVLTLANGGVYFFQAGTEELVNEWVSTCNYWAARQSKEPLAGGVSNMEYGWNRVVDDPFLHDRSASFDDVQREETEHADSLSIRSGRSKYGKKEGAVSMRSSPWADRIIINDWKPPLPPSVSSTHDEETQLEALQKHVLSMKAELKEHNDLRGPMMSLYQSRSSNSGKAMANWEKKSQHLLTEIVKYDSYIDSLKAAMTLRLRRRGEKALEKALTVASPDEDIPSGASKWKGYPDEETIVEVEEPPSTPGPGQMSSFRHRRDGAEGLVE